MGLGRSWAYALALALALLLALSVCSGEMSPTVTVTNQTSNIARGVRVELAGATLDIPPLRSREKVRLPYTPTKPPPNAGASAKAAVVVEWQGQRRTLPIGTGRTKHQAINNVEILLTNSGVVLESE